MTTRNHGRRLRRRLTGVDLPRLRLAAKAARNPKQAERPLGHRQGRLAGLLLEGDHVRPASVSWLLAFKGSFARFALPEFKTL